MINTGIDIVNINRIRKILLERKTQFYKKIFTPKEIEYISKGGDKPETVAGIFAAKEAISKVLGTGIGMVSWTDIEILHDEKGKPFVGLLNNGEVRKDEIGIETIDLSISHEEDYAMAFAIGFVSKFKRTLDNKMKSELKNLLPKRIEDSHKGTYGRVGIIGGSKGMTGAPYLASQAALRTGTGLVYTMVPKYIETIMSIKLTEAIIRPIEDKGKGHFTKESLPEIIKEIESLDTIGIGPGLGIDGDRLYLIEEIIKAYKKPIVLDADAINCISMNLNILLNRYNPIIITPHPGELGRLLGKSTKEIQENRIYYSKYASGKYNIIVVLKGFNTIVASPKDDVYINETGNPGMATAGSGDVLTGMIASLLGQGLKPIDAAKLGVFCHGLAGDLGSLEKGEYGLIASDILDNIPYVFKEIHG